MHIDYYKFDKNKEHNQRFLKELKIASKSIGIRTPKVVAYGVEDAVIYVYRLNNGATIYWFGKEEKDNVESQLSKELARIKCDKENPYVSPFTARINKMSKIELEQEILNEEDLLKEIIGSEYNSEQSKFTQSPTTVSKGLKIISSRIRIEDMKNLYNKKFKYVFSYPLYIVCNKIKHHYILIKKYHKM